jgi:hypothetical protein
MTNAIKVLLQMTSVSLQPVPSLYYFCILYRVILKITSYWLHVELGKNI